MNIRPLLALCFALVLAGWTHGNAGGGGGSTVQLNFAAQTATGCGGTAGINCLSWTRSTQQTCENPGNAISYASANTPCAVSTGYQFYGPSTNLITSQVAANWSCSNASISSGTAPDGNSTAFTITDSGSGIHDCTSPSAGFSYTVNKLVTFTWFAAAGTAGGGVTTNEYQWGAVFTNALSLTSGIDFDATNCLILAGAGSPNGSNVKVFQPQKFVASGVTWCKFGYTALATSSSSTTLKFAMVNGLAGYAAGQSYTAGGSTILAWGFDVEVGDSAVERVYCPSSVSPCSADSVTDGGADTTLKTLLHGAALRVVVKTGAVAENQAPVEATTAPIANTLIGVGTALTALGIGDGSTQAYLAFNNWNSGPTGLKSAGMIKKYANANYVGISADASGRSLAINGQTAASDSNGLSLTTTEYIGSLSSGANPCDCVIALIQGWNTRNDSAMLASTVNGAVPALLTAYTGQTSSHLRNNNTAFASLYTMSRSIHYAQGNIVSPVVVYGNYYHPNSASPETGPGGTTTFTAGIEYPIGTCYQGTFAGGSTTGSAATISTISTDPYMTTAGGSTPLVIPAGQFYWTREWRHNANGLVAQSQNAIHDNIQIGGPGHIRNDVMASSNSDPGDHTVDCASITDSANDYYYPDAVVASTQQRIEVIIGDSRTFSYNDAFDDMQDFLGDPERIYAPNYPVMNLSSSGDGAVGFQTPGNSPNRTAEITYGSHLFVSVGGNDVFNDGHTAAAVESAMTTLYTYETLLHGGAGGPVYQTTTYSQTCSSDGFNTLGNQTLWGTNVNESGSGSATCGGTLNSTTSINEAINAWIIANATTGLSALKTACQSVGYLSCATYGGDLDFTASPIDISAGGHLYWCINATVTGVCTADNLHPTAFAEHQLANYFLNATLP